MTSVSASTHTGSRRVARLALLALPLAGGAGAMAGAETRDPFVLKPAGPLLRDDVAGARQIAGYSAEGVRLGALMVYPQVTVRADADSNLLNRASAREGDVALRLLPAVRAEGAAGSTRYTLSAEGGIARHARLTSQNHETFAVEARGAMPLGGVLTLGASAGYARRHEPNYTVGAAGVDTGATLFTQLSGAVGLRADLGVMRVEGKLDLDRYRYLPVQLGPGAGTADQSFRDLRVLTATGRAEHALPGGKTVFLQGTWRAADSLNAPTCCARTARGGEVAAGLRGDLGGLFAAEIAAGYQWRDYRSAQFADYRAASWRARLDWYATPLISVSITARRDIADAGIPGAAGVVVDSVGAKLFHEARRNLTFTLSTGWARETYRDAAAQGPPAQAPTAQAISAGAEARYALSNRWLVGAHARYRKRRSDSALLPRLGNAVEGGLSLRFQI